MTFYSAFVVSFGLLLALMATIAAWLFRTSGAPLAAKVALPAILVALACYAPLAVNSMLGLPVTASFASLPDHAELVAFVPRDAEKRVDLWLRCDGGVPRAFEVTLDAGMKRTLREAREQMGRGRPAMLAKRGLNRRGRGVGDPLGIGDEAQEYVLDRRALSALPAKQ
jgi:hypothetical protein